MWFNVFMYVLHVIVYKTRNMFFHIFYLQINVFNIYALS